MGLVGRVLKGRRAVEDRMIWVERVLEDCRTMEWIGSEGSLKIVEPWEIEWVELKGP